MQTKKKTTPAITLAFPRGQTSRIQITIICFISQSLSLCLNTKSIQHEFSNKKLYPDLKFVLFYKKRVWPDIEKFCLICGIHHGFWEEWKFLLD